MSHLSCPYDEDVIKIGDDVEVTVTTASKYNNKRYGIVDKFKFDAVYIRLRHAPFDYGLEDYVVNKAAVLTTAIVTRSTKDVRKLKLEELI